LRLPYWKVSIFFTTIKMFARVLINVSPIVVDLE
jgi:hypothetical protein